MPNPRKIYRSPSYFHRQAHHRAERVQSMSLNEKVAGCMLKVTGRRLKIRYCMMKVDGCRKQVVG